MEKFLARDMDLSVMSRQHADHVDGLIHGKASHSKCASVVAESDSLLITCTN